MYCSFCGNQIAANSIFCMHCGKQVPGIDSTPQTPAAQSGTKASGTSCPSCGQPNTQKISALIDANSLKASIPTTQVGQVGDYVVSTTVHQDAYVRTELANKLKPYLGSAFLSTFLLDRAKARLEPPKHEPLFWFGAKPGKPSEDIDPRARAIREEMSDRLSFVTYTAAWNRLYYCDRCGVVFLPGAPGTAQPDQDSIADLIFDTKASSTDVDTCRLHCSSIGGWRLGMKLLAVRTYQGRYTIEQEVTWQEGMLAHSTTPQKHCKKCAEGVEKFVQILQGYGWRQVEEPKKEWWRMQFQRAT